MYCNGMVTLKTSNRGWMQREWEEAVGPVNPPNLSGFNAHTTLQF